jgi:hypothetical protein
MVLKDADSDPTVAVRKNGASVGDSVTVTKRSATTGIYDCSYNPSAEVEGDSFTLEESAAVTGTTTASATYTQTWNVRCIAVERGTNNASTFDPTTQAVELDSASIDAIWNEVLTGATHNIAASAGRRLRQLADTVVLVDGECDAASNAGTDSTGTITLEVGTTSACVGQAIRCENQVRFIASYDAGTRVAQLDRPWCVVPDAGDEYVIFNVRNPLVGLASLALAGSTAAAVNDINTVTEKVDTGLVLDGVVYQFTENMLELGPSGGGGGDATLAKQTEILAAVAGVTSSVASHAARLALEVQIQGFPSVICRNADYATETESEIRLTLQDLTGTAITEIAGTPVASLAWLFGMGTESTPAIIAGAVTWDAGTSELVIQFARSITAAKPLGSITWQIGVSTGSGATLKNRWLGGGTTRLIERQF